jgi:hypothetical protein
MITIKKIPVPLCALAIKSANMFLTGNGIPFLSFIVPITDIIASVVVLYVLIRYGMFFFAPAKTPAPEGAK